MSSVRLKLPKDNSWKSECYQKVLWFTNGFMKVKVKVKVGQSCRTLQPWNSPGQNTGVGGLSLLQEIFPTQGLNPGLPHCRQILYQLSYLGSPRMLEWEAYPFPVDFPDPGIKLGSPSLLEDSLPAELPGKPP